MTRKLNGILPIFLALCLLLGGSSAGGFLANLVLQLGALVILALSVARSNRDSVPRKALAPLGMSALLTTLVILQLIPLPPAIWSGLPGREPIVEGYRLLGAIPPWLPISLDPAGTVRSFLWLLPALAMLVGILLLGWFRSVYLALAIVAVTVVSVFLGAVQIAGGPQSGAYLYDPTNRGIAVGLFANGNHFATMLLVSLPFIAALYRYSQSRGSPAATLASAAACIAATVANVVGLAINGSLAAFGLFASVCLTSLLILRPIGSGSFRRFAPVLAGLAIVSALVVLFGPFDNNLFGAGSQNDGQSRSVAFVITAKAAAQFTPVGSGFGSFVEVYRSLEDPATIDRFYMNNAHNDYLQLALEGGLPAILLVLGMLLWIAVRTKAVWQLGKPDPFAQAATIAIGTILAHSLVDYPLRTAAVSAVLATCIALLAQPRHRSSTRKRSEASGGVHLSAG